MRIKGMLIVGFAACMIFAFTALPAVQEKSFKLDMYRVLSGADLPQVVSCKVSHGDTIESIAKIYQTTTELIKILNHRDNDKLRDGETLKVWAEPFSIVISKKKNLLSLKCGKEVIKTYRVATGVGGNTPEGKFTITTRLENPVWFKKGVPIPPESPENALGPRWLGLDKPQVGIHGTIHPELIGKSVSHGCVRMRNKDVEELYLVIPIGTKVTIVE